MSLRIGDRFVSYKDVEMAIQNYEKVMLSKYSKRDSRTIGKCRVNKNINPELIYYEVKYSCKHGGKTFQTQGKGKKQSSTLKRNCPAYVRFKVSKDGQTLQVVDANEQHENHDQSEASFAHYSEGRRSPNDRNEAKELLTMEANKKLVQERLQGKSGKVITFRDLTNFGAPIKEEKRDDLESLIDFLVMNDVQVHIQKDEQDNFKGMVIQTRRMKVLASVYPEFMAIDSTYNLLKLSTPTYFILIQDGNFQSEVVAMCLLVNEDKDTLKWFLETYKTSNPESVRLKFIMTDKHLVRKGFIQEIYPSSSLIMCIFHTQKMFDGQVTTQKMGITQSQRNVCLEYFQKLVFAKSTEFVQIEEEFEAFAPKAVLEYYQTNWKTTRDEWNINENFVQSELLNGTNSCLEYINSKLKSVISPNSTLRSFLEGLLTIFNSLAEEKDHKAIFSSQKRLVLKHPPESDEYKYSELLTNEATIHVLRQIEDSNLQVYAQLQGFFELVGYPGLVVEQNDCSCLFWFAMCLPCKHIFAVRRFLALPQFDESLIVKRWTLEFLKKNHPAFKKFNAENNNNLPLSVATENTSLTYAQKRKKAHVRSDETGDLCALKSGEAFMDRLKTLDTLNTFWKNGIEVSIVPLVTVMDSDNVLETYEFEENLNSCNSTGSHSMPTVKMPTVAVRRSRRKDRDRAEESEKKRTSCRKRSAKEKRSRSQY